MPRFLDIATSIGKLVDEKNEAYGSSFETSVVALRALYPNGIPADAYGDVLLIARIWDKLQRVATKKDAFGESPFRDIAGYGILGVAASGCAVVEEDEAEEHPDPCGRCGGNGRLYCQDSDDEAECGVCRGYGAVTP